MRTAARYALVGVLLIVIFMIARAPAALVPSLLPDDAAVTLKDARGLLWTGSGTLHFSNTAATGTLKGRPLGAIEWRVAPSALLSGELGLHLRWLAQGQDLTGEIRVGRAHYRLSVDGELDASHLSTLLESYHIRLGGTLRLHTVVLEAPLHEPLVRSGLEGRVDWTGGDVRYRLSGRDHDARVAPLAARLGPGFAATLHETSDGELEILRATAETNGFARLALTRRFMQIFGLEWPGTGAPTDVLLTLEEQLF
jgi:Type II secretion system (T2SS), protein N